MKALRAAGRAGLAYAHSVKSVLEVGFCAEGSVLRPLGP